MDLVCGRRTRHRDRSRKPRLHGPMEMPAEDPFDVAIAGDDLGEAARPGQIEAIERGVAGQERRMMHEDDGWSRWLLGEPRSQPGQPLFAELAYVLTGDMGVENEDAHLEVFDCILHEPGTKQVPVIRKRGAQDLALIVVADREAKRQRERRQNRTKTRVGSGRRLVDQISGDDHEVRRRPETIQLAHDLGEEGLRVDAMTTKGLVFADVSVGDLGDEHRALAYPCSWSLKNDQMYDFAPTRGSSCAGSRLSSGPMLPLNLTVPKGERALYLRIADAVRTAIQDGQLEARERLPSSRALGEALGAHRQTVMDALGELVAEGWLLADPRRGYRVHDALPDRYTSAEPGRMPSRSARRPTRLHIARDVRLAPAPKPTIPLRHSFRAHPDLRLFPFAEFRSHVADSLRRSRANQFGYGDPAGHAGLVEELGAYFRRARALTGRKLLITHGSQEAIFLAAQLLVAPGDHVAVEAPGYAPALAAFRCAGAKLVPLRVDRDGIDPTALADAAAKRRIRVLYLTPLHQFPTTVTLSLARRFVVYEIAARHRIAIVEDDYDHEFHYRCQPLAPLASQDPAGIVLYVASLSKVLFPSTRIGVLAVPEALYEPLRGIRRISTYQNDFLTQDAIARWVADGGFERHLRKMRRIYQQRRDALNELLGAERQRGRDLEWTNPDGGMATWVRLPANAERVSLEAAQLGVDAPGENELVGGRTSRHLRLGFSLSTPGELRTAMALLMTALDRASRPA